MCEMLIHVADSGTSSDLKVEAARFHRGDVVAIEDDGHQWGALDIGPHVKLVKLPGVKIVDVVDLLKGDPPLQPASGKSSIDPTSFAAYPRTRMTGVLGYASIPASISTTGTLFLATQGKSKPVVLNPLYVPPVSTVGGAGGKPVGLPTQGGGPSFAGGGKP